MTNYQSIRTCVCIGENLASALPEVLGVIELPMLSATDLDPHVGRGSDWDQRRAFEWGLLRGVAHRSGDAGTEDICSAQIERLVARR